MNNIEEELNKLPFSFSKKIRTVCSECFTPRIKVVNYELELKLIPHWEGLRYKLYYISHDYHIKDGEKYIGDITGWGYPTIKEAIDELKKELKRVDEI